MILYRDCLMINFPSTYVMDMDVLADWSENEVQTPYDGN